MESAVACFNDCRNRFEHSFDSNDLLYPPPSRHDAIADSLRPNTPSNPTGFTIGPIASITSRSDSQIEWAEWETRFHDAILPGTDPIQARERLLFLLHLNAHSIIEDDVVLDSLRDFMSPDAIERTLLSKDQFFNWRILQRALEHARAWQPGAFRLFERLTKRLPSQEHLRFYFHRGEWISAGLNVLRWIR